MERNDRKPFCVGVKKIMVRGKLGKSLQFNIEKFVLIV